MSRPEAIRRAMMQADHDWPGNFEQRLKLVLDAIDEHDAEPALSLPLPPLTEAEVKAGAEALAEHDDPGVYERGAVIQRWGDYLAASNVVLTAARAARGNA